MAQLVDNNYRLEYCVVRRRVIRVDVMSEEQTVTCSQKLVDVLRDGELPAESYSDHLDRLNSSKT